MQKVIMALKIIAGLLNDLVAELEAAEQLAQPEIEQLGNLKDHLNVYADMLQKNNISQDVIVRNISIVSDFFNTFYDQPKAETNEGAAPTV